MVNLPPDQNESRRRDRILDFDELLAVVLALLGIGSILWWGLSRSQGMLTDAGLLPRRGGEAPAVALPGGEGEPGIFEPRALERNQRSRPESDNSSTGFLAESTESQGSRMVPQQGADMPMVPAAPTTTLPADDLPTTDAETTQPLTIADVPETHWAYPFIKPMFDQGYLPDFPESGFKPDQPLTRGELASLLSQAFSDAPQPSDAISFSDVPASYWAAPAIDNAVAEGFMSGYPEGDFRPDQAVPRYEVLVTLSTGLDLALPPAPEQSLQAFTDLNALPAWAGPKVAAATENNLVVNYPNPGQLKPSQAATRAEIVAMIHQALVQQGKLPAVQSDYVVP